MPRSTPLRSIAEKEAVRVEEWLRSIRLPGERFTRDLIQDECPTMATRPSFWTRRNMSFCLCAILLERGALRKIEKGIYALKEKRDDHTIRSGGPDAEEDGRTDGRDDTEGAWMDGQGDGGRRVHLSVDAE